MEKTPEVPRSYARLTWLDATKGISILLIVFFHFFSAYGGGGYPWPFKLSNLPSFVSECSPASSTGALGCTAGALFAALLQRGPNAVGVFILLSGFGLTYSLAKRGYPQGGWMRWYRRRLLRLFPMYWTAHLVYLISPFVHRQDPIDYRFFLSFLGDRVYPIDKIFYYLTPAWWFVGLLIELYLVFPLLFGLLKKVGPGWFLAICALITVFSRYMLFGVIEANANYLQGALFTARLWEFAAGMVLALFYRSHPYLAEEWLFSGKTLLGGILVYNLGLYSYQPTFTYAFSDALIGIGLFIILVHIVRWAERLLSPLGWILSTAGVYSYGLYLLHQPYVIYFGKRMGELGLPFFIGCALLIVTIIALLAILIERYVNRLTSRMLDRFDAGATPSKV